jgi:hypothetical protein
MARTVVVCLLCLLSSLALAQGVPASDPKAVALAAQSMAALTSGTTIGDVTLTGTVTWGGSDTGTATLSALGTGESRMDLALTSGTRTEIRDAQTGAHLGQWFAPNNASGYFAAHNCFIDAVWFFPALGSLAAGPNVVLSYTGQESRNGGTVQHITVLRLPVCEVPRSDSTTTQHHGLLRGCDHPSSGGRHFQCPS